MKESDDATFHLGSLVRVMLSMIFRKVTTDFNLNRFFLFLSYVMIQNLQVMTDV